MPQPFSSAVMTDNGARLLNRAQAGEIRIQFTRVAVGSGLYGAEEKTLENLQAQTGLKLSQNSYPVSEIEVFNERSVKVTVLITNQNPSTKEVVVETGYYINEMGLYAKPSGCGDDEEILYSIAVTTGENGDFMPPYNGYHPAQIIQEYYATVGNAGNVIIQASPGAAVMAEDLDRFKEEMSRRLEEINGVLESKNGFTDEDKKKLDSIDEGANKTVVDTKLDKKSKNPVGNAVVTAEIEALKEEIKNLKALLPSTPPTAEDAGKVLKINADGQVTWAEDYGASWQARHPDFAHGSDTYSSSGNSHFETTYDNGDKTVTDRADDGTITEELYVDGVKVAQKETTSETTDGGKHIIERLVEL